MQDKIQNFLQPYLKKDLPDVRPGQTIRVHQKIKEAGKERIHVFEGQVLARKHGREIGATITVRRMASGVGTEVILPLHSPLIEKIEILKKPKVRRAKLYYLRKASGQRAKLKEV
jgi:large subunit ribosomal protein L19